MNRCSHGMCVSCWRYYRYYQFYAGLDRWRAMR